MELRFGESSRVLSAVCFAFMTILMARRRVPRFGERTSAVAKPLICANLWVHRGRQYQQPSAHKTGSPYSPHQWLVSAL
jgi:hypothetical protein